MDHKNRITGLFYWKPIWIAYQQEVGAWPKEYVRMFWAENHDAVRLVYLAWLQDQSVEVVWVPAPKTPILQDR